MTQRERFFARLNGEKVDRIPNLCIIMGFGAKHIGASLRDFLLDYKTLVKANVETAKDFNLDILQAISDPFREAEGFGAKAEYPENDQPHCKVKLLQSIDEAEKLIVPEPLENARMADRINAVKTMKNNYGDTYPVVGWVEGTFAEAANLRGVSELMMDIFDKPDKVRILAEKCLEAGIKFAKAQVDAGADIIGVGDAVVSLLGPTIYEDMVFEYHQRLFTEIKKMGAVGRLHICGNISSIIDKLAFTGADIIDLDWMVDFETAAKALEGKAAPCGNFDPVSVLLNGDKNSIKESIEHIIKVGGDRSFIMAGCEVPIYTSDENFKAVFETLAAL